jgi:peptidoglycan/xylan/chitin deacetylase (PgdA/CDA1 family)
MASVEFDRFSILVPIPRSSFEPLKGSGSELFVRKIRILQYNNVGHYPSEAMEDGLPPESLAEQIEYLLTNGYHIVGLDEALAWMEGNNELPENSLAITIDGGYADAFHNVLPLLERHGTKAAFFIAPELIGKSRTVRGHAIPCMSWDQVRALAAKGMIIGHYGCKGRAFKRVEPQIIEEDIITSKPIFQQEFGGQPVHYAVFEGTLEPEAIPVLKKHGYRFFLTKSPTKQRPNLYAIGRIQVDDDDMNIFMTKISSTYLQFKDSPYWKYIRKYGLAKAFHHVSEFYNHSKNYIRSSNQS